MDGWADIAAGAKYVSRSERVVRYWLKKGLRHVRVEPGGVLIKYEWLDQFLESREQRQSRADKIVDEVFRSLKK